MKTDPKYIANIVMHVVLISTLITIFFFTYATIIEEEIVNIQINNIISDFTEDIDLLPIESIAVIKGSIGLIVPPDMSAIDKKIADANDELTKKVIILVTVVVIFSMWFIYGMSKKYNFNFGDLLKHNLIVLVFVGLTEFFFLTYIGKQYRSGDSFFVKKTILTTLKKFSEKHEEDEKEFDIKNISDINDNAKMLFDKINQLSNMQIKLNLSTPENSNIQK
jgi:hypothetical protein